MFPVPQRRRGNADLSRGLALEEPEIHPALADVLAEGLRMLRIAVRLGLLSLQGQTTNWQRNYRVRRGWEREEPARG